MKTRLMTFFISIVLSAGAGYSADMKYVVAYPVPFNPRSNVLTIGYPSSHSGVTSYNVKVEIFDINGDRVAEKKRSLLPLKWNGRNSGGRMVKPGMYILKVTLENDEGDYGKKIIRILVDY